MRLYPKHVNVLKEFEEALQSCNVVYSKGIGDVITLFDISGTIRVDCFPNGTIYTRVDLGGKFESGVFMLSEYTNHSSLDISHVEVNDKKIAYIRLGGGQSINLKVALREE